MGGTGCARRSTGEWSQPVPHAPGRASPPAVIVTPATGSTGRILTVNTTARYVVISYAIGVPLPPLEQRLNVYRNGLKVAEIKITGPSRDSNTIGDIVAGECQVADEVRTD